MLLRLAALSLVIACLWRADASSYDKKGKVQMGTWGGEHVGLWVENNRSRLEYDCARGTIEQALTIDSKGRFKAKGTHIFEGGGPTTADDEPDRHPALYAGHVAGQKMTITITLTDTNKTLGPYTLTYGKSPSLTKCR